MNLNTFIVNIYCETDDFMKKFFPSRTLRTRGPLPQLTDSEILGFDTDKDIFGFFNSFYSHYFPNLTGWIFGSSSHELSSSGFFSAAWHYILTGLILIAEVIIFIILLIFLLILAFIISMIVVSPFNDTLSEKVEVIAKGEEEIPFSFSYLLKSTWRSVIVALQNTAFFLLIPIVLFILNIIPGIGNIIYLILANLFASFDMGFVFIDFPMSRRLWPFSKRLKFAWQKKYHLIGFGILLLIPLFPFIFNSPLVAGGTLLFSDLLNKSKDNEDR